MIPCLRVRRPKPLTGVARETENPLSVFFYGFISEIRIFWPGPHYSKSTGRFNGFFGTEASVERV